MRRPALFSLCTGWFAASLSLTLPAIARAGEPAAAGTAAVPAESAYLPDTTVLARVNDRVTTVYDFCDRYYASDIPTRPAPDSAGRVTFLNTMIDKDVMGLTAIASTAPLRFEDRLALRATEEEALAKTLYSRRVYGPIVITEDDLRERHPQFGFELRLRYLQIGDLATAQQVYADLNRGRITWNEAAQRYSLGPDSLAEGDLGWVGRGALGHSGAFQVFALRPAGLSRVIKDDDGYYIWQCIDRRPAPLPPLVGVRRTLVNEIRAERAAPLKEKLYLEAEARAGVEFDSTNVAWLAMRFKNANPPVHSREGSASIDLRNRTPQLTPSDTSRVLARVRGVPFTAHAFVSNYQTVPAVLRSKITSFAPLFDMVRKMVLEPQIVAMAREDGLEKDPEIIASLENREEQLRVMRMYDDSVSVRVSVTEADRRKYYQDHVKEFVSRDRVVYAGLARTSEAGADSVIARLDHGVSPRDILRADSLSGWHVGAIHELLQGEPNNFSTILFGELKPGQSTKVGPGPDGSWVILQLMEFDPTRPMSYDEVANIVDESVQNIAAERLLREMLGRLRARYRIESHPELVMRMRLTVTGTDL